MFRLLNLIPPLAIGLCLYMAYQRNLFEIGLLLGRTFFAFLLAMALFGPVQSYLASLVQFAEPYGNAAAFFCIWFGVMLGFDEAVTRMLKVDPAKMRFRYKTPGFIAGGILAGMLMSLALVGGGVLLPEIEGRLLEVDKNPVGRLPSRADSLYSVLVLTPPGTLDTARMKAGHHWARAQAQKCLNEGKTDCVATYAAMFRKRYEPMKVPEKVRKHMARELSDMVPD
jgi:hypothetical protein